MGKLVKFNYTIIGREYCKDEKVVIIDIEQAKQIGWKEIKVWSDRKWGMIRQKVFLINYRGVEYGSLKPDTGSLSNCKPCSPGGDDFMIFEQQFEKTFE